MKQRRLAGLLGVMVVLLILRWWKPPQTGEGFEVAEPVQRASRMRPIPSAAIDSDTPMPLSRDVSAGIHAGTRDLESGEPRDIFAVRLPSPPPSPPAVPRQPLRREPTVSAPPPAAQIPQPPRAPVPPLQVIGSWRDENGGSVFLAGPHGVLQGRVGQVLLTDYRIVQITPQQILLRHLPTAQDVSLAVPEAAGALLTSSK